MPRLLTLGCALVFTTTLAQPASESQYEGNLPIDHPAIQYDEVSPHDPVARLAAQIDAGTATLDASGRASDRLASLLRLLDISTDTQGLVFSKTSVQHPRISPRNPRAIYFNDEVAVGFVRGSDVIELAALDPRQGVRFYTLEARTPDRPVISRRTECLRCHQGPATIGVPGFFVTSVFPAASGTPDPSGAIVTDHRTPFADRWGGWYVTGTHGDQRHRGNAVARNPAEPTVLEADGTQNLTSLAGRFDPEGYLTASSDIVALMTFEHQTRMTNLLTRLGWEARIAEHAAATEAARGARLAARVEEVVRYLLFVDEAPFLAPITGVSTFRRTFPQRGPRDRQGRSLRAFDLQRRLFRYPLSYGVYSSAFDALPTGIRAQVCRRLYDVLSGADRSPAFAPLSSTDRTTILEILRETKPNLPAYFRTQHAGAAARGTGRRPAAPA